MQYKVISKYFISWPAQPATFDAKNFLWFVNYSTLNAFPMRTRSKMEMSQLRRSEGSEP